MSKVDQVAPLQYPKKFNNIQNKVQRLAACGPIIALYFEFEFNNMSEFQKKDRTNQRKVNIWRLVSLSA